VRRLAPWLGPLVVLLLELPLIWTSPFVGEWFLFWYGGHIVASGGSLYDPASWMPATQGIGPLAHGIAVNTLDGNDLETMRTDGRWLWPPAAGLLLAPFGALPLEIGVPLLHAATIAVAVGSTIALVRVLTPPEGRPLALALLFASPPLVQVMRAASLTVVVLPSLALLYATLRRPDGVRLGIAGAGLMFRVQDFLAALPAVVGGLPRAGAPRMLIVAGATWLAINAVAFAIAPVPLDPSLLDAARSYTLHDNSSTWRLAWEIAPDQVAPIALAFLTAALVGAFIAVRGTSSARRPQMLIACALALGVAAAPYTHTYDDLALFPAWLLALQTLGARSARPVALGAFAVIVVVLGYGWSAYLVGAAGTRAAVALTPYLAIALLAIGTRSSAAVAADRTALAPRAT
jgi:hypothetical protein